MSSRERELWIVCFSRSFCSVSCLIRKPVSSLHIRGQILITVLNVRMQSDLPAYELSTEGERRKIGVEFQIETVPSLCKWAGALLGSGTQSRVIPLQQLVYVLEDTSKYRVAVLTEMALRALQECQLWNHHAARSPLLLRSGCSDMYYWWASTSLSPLLLQSPCAPLSWSRCRDQRGARAADLRAVRSCFFSCTLPSANRDRLVLAQKLKRTCREYFCSSLSGYSVVTSFLFNVLLLCWVRNAEQCLAELAAGVGVFHHCPSPPTV